MSSFLDSLVEETLKPYHDSFLNIAAEIATWSKATKAKVGCIITHDKRIVASGYNGTPSGFSNVCEDENNKTLNTVIHAEANAILFAAKNGLKLDGTTLYCTLSPCIGCSKMIIQAGIRNVYYRQFYKNSDGIDLLKQANINVYEFN